MKVVSFSLWGDDPKYIRGAAANLRLASIHYRDWTVRVYCEPKWKDTMAGLGFDVRERTITKGSWEGLFWRFEPIMDPDVELFVSRDLDSRLNPREEAAVSEWLKSGKFAHVMRDHPWHDVAIVGGMWGCHHWPEFGDHLKRWTIFDHKGCDQEFLQQHIWPIIVYRVLIHDSAHSAVGILPFPKHDPMIPAIHGPFVGSILP